MRIGATFSATNARWLGLDAEDALARVIELGLDPLRLCGYWDQPPDDLDWQLDQATRAGRQVALTIGMKAPRWPEFHLPPEHPLDLHRGGEVGAHLPIALAAMAQAKAMVERFRDRSAIAWWQVENEPSNKSGPERWWISAKLVAQEVAVVRTLDDRPVMLTAFGHFSRIVDESSGHRICNLEALAGRGSVSSPSCSICSTRGTCWASTSTTRSGRAAPTSSTPDPRSPISNAGGRRRVRAASSVG